MTEIIKKLAEKMPFQVARHFNRIPMSVRLGKKYNSFKNKALQDHLGRHSCLGILKDVESLVNFSCKNVLFYRDFYSDKNLPNSFQHFEDIFRIPIVSKKDFHAYPLSARSVSRMALKKSNTGGTTGQPLEFYLERAAYAREWAHIHAIWSKLGYNYTDEKLTIRGGNIGSRYYKYNFNQNEFLINAYAPLRGNINACGELIHKRNIKWIHGYPSSVFSFLRELESVDSVLFEILIKNVKGVFLGSEFPAPHYRDYIEKHCGLRSISWYGHSEMAVLAPEREPGSGIYFPFYSYGFPEAVQDGDVYRLVATSTHNYATPFIRYDTGDLIEPTFRDGLLESFRIKEGRNGESVIDQNGRSISLTGLIFGRHHKGFNHCEHIQVRQISPGKLQILITSREIRTNWSDLFDFTNSSFEVSFKQIDSPIRTALGKVQLLLR